MAQAKKTTTKKKTSSSKKTSAKAQPTQPPDPVVPVRREVGAVLSLFLALFVGISYFMNEGAFILFFSDLIKGLIGWGYWLTAPVFLLVAIILGFHRGRPVALRVFCALMIPILAASVMSLMMYKYQLDGGDIKIMCSSPTRLRSLSAYMARCRYCWSALCLPLSSPLTAALRRSRTGSSFR